MILYSNPRFYTSSNVFVNVSRILLPSITCLISCLFYPGYWIVTTGKSLLPSRKQPYNYYILSVRTFTTWIPYKFDLNFLNLNLVGLTSFDHSLIDSTTHQISTCQPDHRFGDPIDSYPVWHSRRTGCRVQAVNSSFDVLHSDTYQANQTKVSASFIDPTTYILSLVRSDASGTIMST